MNRASAGSNCASGQNKEAHHHLRGRGDRLGHGDGDGDGYPLSSIIKPSSPLGPSQEKPKTISFTDSPSPSSSIISELTSPSPSSTIINIKPASVASTVRHELHEMSPEAKSLFQDLVQYFSDLLYDAYSFFVASTSTKGVGYSFCIPVQFKSLLKHQLIMLLLKSTGVVAEGDVHMAASRQTYATLSSRNANSADFSAKSISVIDGSQQQEQQISDGNESRCRAVYSIPFSKGVRQLIKGLTGTIAESLERQCVSPDGELYLKLLALKKSG